MRASISVTRWLDGQYRVRVGAEGVVKTRVGYTGGQTPDPTYEQLCSHTTGHAEAGRGVGRPRPGQLRTAAADVLANPHPTTRNRRGWDIADRYRSAIFIHAADPAALAVGSLEQEQHSLTRPIVTEITPAGTFYEAEDYQQQYFEKQSRTACAVNAERPHVSRSRLGVADDQLSQRFSFSGREIGGGVRGT